MGKPTSAKAGVSDDEYIVVGGKPGEVKHLSTLRKRKQLVIPLVVASERGRAQTGERKLSLGLWGAIGASRKRRSNEPPGM